MADNGGSGIYVEEMDFYSLNDTIAGNPDYGILLTGTLTTTAYLSNTILWGNENQFVAGNPARHTLVATDSDIDGGFPGAGNIDQDPLFVDAANGDYHLHETSPAIDQVDPALGPPIDRDGIPRPVLALTDMGAYEWYLAGVTLAPDQSSPNCRAPSSPTP